MKIGMESFQECRLFAPKNKGPKCLKSSNEYYFLIGKYVVVVVNLHSNLF